MVLLVMWNEYFLEWPIPDKILVLIDLGHNRLQVKLLKIVYIFIYKVI